MTLKLGIMAVEDELCHYRKKCVDYIQNRKLILNCKNGRVRVSRFTV